MRGVRRSASAPRHPEASPSRGQGRRKGAFRQPDLGLAGGQPVSNEQLPAEKNIEWWFCQLIVLAGGRVERWANWTELGQDSPARE